MAINEADVEKIVKQILTEMGGSSAAAPSFGSSTPGAIPKTAHVAVLVEKERFEVKEYPIPPLGDDDILVRVEGCGVCGTDAHEFKRDPFGLIPVALGHEGTGEIVAMGKNVKKDSAGKDLHIGDKVVTCISEKCARAGRAVPAADFLREPAAWLTQHSQFTPLDAASHS